MHRICLLSLTEENATSQSTCRSSPKKSPNSRRGRWLKSWRLLLPTLERSLVYNWLDPMRQLFLRYPNKTRRMLEIAIPLTSWFIITMPLWLSFWHPALVAYLIITFDVYWFYKSVTLVYFAVR